MPYPAAGAAPGSNGSFGTLAATGGLTLSGSATDITTGVNEHLALMPNGTGNVGVGLTNPVADFQVHDGTNGLFSTQTMNFLLGQASYTVVGPYSSTVGGDAAAQFNITSNSNSGIALFRFGMVGGATGATGEFGAGGTTAPVFANSVFLNTKSAVPMLFAINTTEYMRLSSTGNFGVRHTNPTAKLHVAAGSAAASTAPIKLDSGALLTTAEAGAVEFLTNDMYYTGTDGTRRRIAVNSQVIRLRGSTVAALGAGTQGDKAFVTDALAPTYLTAVVGGGSVVTEVFYNGTAWVCT